MKKLLKLDELNLITLLPGNRIRLNINRDFDWLPDGPVRTYFRDEGMQDFLDSRFGHKTECFSFSHVMLTDEAIAKLQVELRQLKRKFVELHEESLNSPLPKRKGTALLMAMRPWVPPSFAKLRRK